MSEKYSFRYIHRPNKGLIKTLNEALSLSHGVFFTMLGSDDYYIQNKIELQVDFFNRFNDYAICYGNTISIDKNGKIGKKGKTNGNPPKKPSFSKVENSSKIK
jgi:alpha-1,3-rhamnosyltransferase